jgi:hypothetical protein
MAGRISFSSTFFHFVCLLFQAAALGPGIASLPSLPSNARSAKSGTDTCNSHSQLRALFTLNHKQKCEEEKEADQTETIIKSATGAAAPIYL